METPKLKTLADIKQENLVDLLRFSNDAKTLRFFKNAAKCIQAQKEKLEEQSKTLSEFTEEFSNDLQQLNDDYKEFISLYMSVVD